ncbi:4 TM domain-containing transmembrane protein [Acrasis kona]|uniref:4 TM domain-containing transmembrane protein n=1 Tax=Acrasis kona TaxID=1008807 RepID=A0AAW2ZJQ5_9EUKA
MNDKALMSKALAEVVKSSSTKMDDEYETFHKAVLARIQHNKERQERTITKEEASLDVPYTFEPCEKYLGNLTELVLKRVRSVFMFGVKLYGPIHILPVLIFKRKQLLQNPGQIIYNLLKNITRSSSFLVLYQTLFVLGLASSNKLFKIDHPFAFVASFLPGVSLLCEQSNRRTELMLYCIPRVYEVVTILGQQQRWWWNLDYQSLCLFCLTMGVLSYFYAKEPKSIKPSILSLMRQIVGVN